MAAMDSTQPVRDTAMVDKENNRERGLSQQQTRQQDPPREGEGEVELKLNPTQSTEAFPPLTTAIPSMCSLYLAMFLVALDRTIIATATPRITDSFHSIDDIGWYGSAYLMTGAAFQLLWGRIYTFWPQKTCFLSAIAIFELGSLLCGVAPNSTAFIIGRAVAGAGSSGIFGGALSVMIHLVPLQKRPLFAGFGGAIFGVAAAVIAFLIRVPTNVQSQKFSTKEKLRRLDPLGSVCFLPGVVCLVLALQWGGSKYPWDSARVIAIKAASAVHSGIMVLPMLLSLVVGAISAGATLSLIVGYFTPYMIACGILTSIGAGLITTFTTGTGHAKWIGFQVILGFGLGLGLQQPNMAAQTVLPKADVPSGTALIFFGQQLGGAIFLAVAQSVFANRLASVLVSRFHIDPSTIIRSGATEFRRLNLNPREFSQVLLAYNDAIVDAFRVGLGLSCVVIIPALFMEWKSVRKEKKNTQKVRKEPEGEEKV
ncbi:MAG: hypothetical protein Q9160_005957 [Pyrenula sp. 1 TL-2023]